MKEIFKDLSPLPLSVLISLNTLLSEIMSKRQIRRRALKIILKDRDGN